MTNPDRDELVKLADMLQVNGASEHNLSWKELQDIVAALRRLASSDSGVKGEPVRWEWCCFEDNEQRTGWQCERHGDQNGWEKLAESNPTKYRIVRRPLYTAPPADAGMREALERARGAIVLAISFLTRDCGTDRINKTAESLATILVKEDRAALAALTAPGATTKSDGLCQCSWSCVEASNCRRKAALKSDVEALAATTAERPGAVTSEPEPSTSDSARDDVPLGYERVTDCTTLPGDKFRYALDNNGVTGKVIGHFRPIKPGPSDPSSTRSEVTVEIKHLISSARAFLAHFNPCVLAEDKSQQWQSLEHQCNRVERALLDQFEIRSK